MTSSLASVLSSLLAQAPTLEEVNAKVDLDSLILLEVFYFFTVVVMWLIHVGFMAYEAGAARRKNIMSTAMKNILTIAVVTPTFYYFGWYIYGCFEHGGPAQGHAGPTPSSPGSAAPPPHGRTRWGQTSRITSALVFFLAFLLFSWTTASIMSGALIERVRLSAYLILAVVLGSGVWIMDAAWGWSAGGWLTTHYGFHDSIASLVVHGVAGAFTLGVLLNLGPRIGKYDLGAGENLPTPQHPSDPDGADADLHRLLRLLRRLPGHPVHGHSGLAEHLPHRRPWARSPWSSPSASRRLHGRLDRQQGRPVLDLSGGLAGVISVSGGADVYHPSLAYLLSVTGGMLAVCAGTCIERKLRIDDAVGAVAVHGSAASTACSWSASSPAGIPTGVNNVPVSFGGQLMGILTFFPLAFLPGYIVSWVLKKTNLLRVPPEVELEGLDMAEFQQDFFPEFERVPETIVLPDGEEVESAPILLEESRASPTGIEWCGVRKGGCRDRQLPLRQLERVTSALLDLRPENSTGTYIMTALGIIVMVAAIVYWSGSRT